jgi:hypothetical protein
VPLVLKRHRPIAHHFGDNRDRGLRLLRLDVAIA